jgi:hypothetical protein
MELHFHLVDIVIILLILVFFIAIVFYYAMVFFIFHAIGIRSNRRKKIIY